MEYYLALMVVGLIGLYYGAEWLVKGAARLASSFGISPLVIGLTVVAFGTSAPELLVSVTAAIRNSADISIGNVVGSNVANIGLILGVTALLFPITVGSRVVRRELPLMIGVSLVTFLIVLDGELGRWDGLLLFAGLIGFNVLSYSLTEEDDAVLEQEFEEFEEIGQLASRDHRLRELGRAGVGIVLLMIGARLMVDGATGTAEMLQISEVVIGVTLVAFGTSLPELATSLVAALHQESDISIGNIIGSNIYNLLAVLGITSMAHPLSIRPDILHFDFPIMLGFSIVLWPFVLNNRLGRWKAGLLLAGYIGFVTISFT